MTNTTNTNAPNISLIANFVDNPEQLFRLIEQTTDWNTRLSARKTASFGSAYAYSNLSYPKTDLPAWATAFLPRIRKICGFLANNCLINYYANGNDRMGFHSDDTTQMQDGTGVAIISLGAEREIVYQRKDERSHEHRFLLTQGSLLYMDDKVQDDWLHAILKDDTTTPRISLTFRVLKA